MLSAVVKSYLFHILWTLLKSAILVGNKNISSAAEHIDKSDILAEKGVYLYSLWIAYRILETDLSFGKTACSL